MAPVNGLVISGGFFFLLPLGQEQTVYNGANVHIWSFFQLFNLIHSVFGRLSEDCCSIQQHQTHMTYDIYYNHLQTQ